MLSLAKFAVVGLSGVVLLKLFATILLPMMGLLMGLFALTVKVALVAAIAFFVYTMVRRRDSEVEVEVGDIRSE